MTSPANNRNMEDTPEEPKKKEQPNVERLLLDAKGVAKLLSVSRSTIYQLNNTGELGPMSIRLATRRLWRYEELVAWVRAGCPPRGQWVKMAQDQGFGHQFGQRF